MEKKQERRPVTVWINKSDFEAIKKEAEAMQTSISTIMRNIIKKHIKKTKGANNE